MPLNSLADELVGGGDRRGFRQAVSLGDVAAGHLLPAFGDRALHRHAAGQRQDQRLEVELAEILVVEQRVEQRVEPGEDVDRILLQLLDEARNVARIGDEDVVRALLHAHQRVHRQREDVIERQHADIGEIGRLRLHRIGVLHPQRILRDIGEHVAVEQHGALGDAGGSAGILQEGDVVAADLGRLEGLAGADLQRIVEFDVARQRPGRHHLLDAPDDEIDEHALDAEQVAHRRDDDMLDLGPGDRRLQRAGEILQDDDRLGAGIVELLLQLARRVERVDVDHGVAGPQHGHHRDRILQHVGHHHRDARALLQSRRLQIGAEIRRQPLEVGEGQHLAHAGKGRAAGKLPARRGEQVADRRGAERTDLGRHVLRVVLQPRLVGNPDRRVFRLGCRRFRRNCSRIRLR